MKESRLARPATEKSTDASVAALSETLADLSREIANIIIAADGQRMFVLLRPVDGMARFLTRRL